MSFVETFGLDVLMSLVEVTFLHLCFGNVLLGKGTVQTELRRGVGRGGGQCPMGRFFFPILGRVLEKIPGSGSGSAVQVRYG